MTLTRAASLAVNCVQCDERAAAAVERAVGLADVELQKAKDSYAADNELNKGKLGILKRELDEANAWYKHPAIWYFAGIGTVVAAILVTRETLFEDRR